MCKTLSLLSSFAKCVQRILKEHFYICSFIFIVSLILFFQISENYKPKLLIQIQ